MTFFLQEEAQSSNHHYEIFSYEKKNDGESGFLGFEPDHPEASFFSGKLRLPCNNKLLWSSRNHALKSTLLLYNRIFLRRGSMKCN